MNIPTISSLEPPPNELGLTSTEAAARLTEVGPNQIVPQSRGPNVLVWLLRPLTDPMVVLLLAASVTYLALGDERDAIVTLIAVLPITLVSLVLEVRAERTLEQLKRLTAATAVVWRDGWRQVVPADTLVPGDLVVLQEGDLIPADGFLIAGAQLMVDESALTGESQPVVKDTAGDPDARSIFAGTTLLSGRGIARVTATGRRTRYGQIGTLVAEIRQPPTPLQRVIRRLVGQLAVVAVVVCVGLVALELVRGAEWGAAVIAGISLAIAAIPEEFPMVYTLYLTLGAWRLARNHALIRRLAGVETLGATTVICSDKTGTLTLGHLEVTAIAAADGTIVTGAPLSPAARGVLEAAVLACEPSPFDPLEQAILRYAAAHDVDVAAIHGGVLLHDYPFDPVDKYMAHVWHHTGVTSIAAKGALEGILARTSPPAAVRRQALAANAQLAGKGMRVIAVAGGTLAGATGDRGRDENALQFLGLVAFADPLRPGVMEALAECRAAGIRVVMITGDHPLTAQAVAESLGLLDRGTASVVTGDQLDAADEATLAAVVQHATVFARTRPEQKYRLVRALRAQGEVVAMTGDGINDAPALREADIGVAMGQRGTEVARAAATLVLLDDNFATIVGAVRDGRRIFQNLQRAFTYLIAFHIPLLSAALVIPLVGAPLLLLPIHLVWLELIVHPTASLVFEADPPDPDLMRRPPRRPGAGLLARKDVVRTLAEGSMLFGGVLAVYLLALARDVPEHQARAMGLATLILGQVMLVLMERAPETPVWRLTWRTNRALPAVLGATIASLLVALYVPPLTALLKLAPLPLSAWGIVCAAVLVATLWREPVKALRPRRAHLAS
jgi:Ca2+-transporting ATPase